MATSYKKILFFPAIIFVSLLVFTSCDKDNPDKLSVEKSYLHSLMNDVYYWYKEIPANIDPDPISSLYDYFDTLLVAKDRWSWMISGEEYTDSEKGVYLTYGASYAQPIDHYNDYSVRVRYVFDNSPMSEKGVKRGFELTHLNGTPVANLIQNGTFNAQLNNNTNSFTFKRYDGTSYTFTANAREVSTKSVLKSMVITADDFPGLPYPVAYFNYYAFKASMLSDIETAMAVFKAANVKELILDLRYNGGGDGAATQMLSNYLAPASANGKVVARRKHNDKLSSYDTQTSTMTIVSRVNNSLDLNRLIILTGGGTASASEVIINGFRPLMNVLQIGRTTYGKPNGMYVWFYPEDEEMYPDFVFLPIAFYSVNSLGQGDYEDGIVPDHQRPDDLYHDFGLEEDWLQSALTYISTGAWPEIPAARSTTIPLKPGRRIKVDEDAKNYGVYKDKKPL
ncbi:MAG: S41 family peptidase [Bacteroidales bacterium]|nr:S41 family peptidase [Bacteroidales bacterium]